MPANAEYEHVKDQIAHLPPLMQYETLQELKENNRYTNRSVFAAVKDQPADYSALQIRNYLKTQAINSHIEAVRKGLAGSNVVLRQDGTSIPTKRIVSDNTAEYILYQPDEASTGGDVANENDADEDDRAGKGLRRPGGAKILGDTTGDTTVPYDFRTVFERRSAKGSTIINHTLSMRRNSMIAQQREQGAGRERGGESGAGSGGASVSQEVGLKRVLDGERTEAGGGAGGEGGEEEEDEEMETVLDLSAGGFGVESTRVVEVKVKNEGINTDSLELFLDVFGGAPPPAGPAGARVGVCVVCVCVCVCACVRVWSQSMCVCVCVCCACVCVCMYRPSGRRRRGASIAGEFSNFARVWKQCARD